MQEAWCLSFFFPTLPDYGDLYIHTYVYVWVCVCRRNLLDWFKGCVLYVCLFPPPHIFFLLLLIYTVYIYTYHTSFDDLSKFFLFFFLKKKETFIYEDLREHVRILVFSFFFLGVDQSFFVCFWFQVFWFLKT